MFLRRLITLFVGTDVYTVPPASVLEPSVLALPPTTESAFHIAEFTPYFPRRYFSFVEKVFHIAKFTIYLIEK